MLCGMYHKKEKGHLGSLKKSYQIRNFPVGEQGGQHTTPSQSAKILEKNQAPRSTFREVLRWRRTRGSVAPGGDSPALEFLSRGGDKTSSTDFLPDECYLVHGIISALRLS